MDVILPAKFQATALTVKSPTQLKTYELSDNRGPTTSVVCWFLSSQLSGAQIEDGSVVVMSYYLRCDPWAPVPRSIEDPLPVSRAARAIRTWIAGGISVRHPIVLPLHANTGTLTPMVRDLSEADNDTFRLADSMVNDLPLNVGLAIFKRTQHGSGFELRNGEYTLDGAEETSVSLEWVVTKGGREVTAESGALLETDIPPVLEPAWLGVPRLPEIVVRSFAP